MRTKHPEMAVAADIFVFEVEPSVAAVLAEVWSASRIQDGSDMYL